ncbi:MAG: hypothetical protein E6959_11645, partial [Eikenella corrodens]|nr:hypothetical protein [Eikenella corrodens]
SLNSPFYPAPPEKSLLLSSCLMMLTTVRSATVLWSASSAFSHFSETGWRLPSQPQAYNHKFDCLFVPVFSGGYC